MTSTAQLAKHFYELYFGGDPTRPNFKDEMQDITWQEANTRIHSFNSIAALIRHLNGSLTCTSNVLNGEEFKAQTEINSDHLPLHFQEDWDELVEDTFTKAEVFARQIETLPDGILFEHFPDEKNGTYYQNLLGVIESAQYLLGQIVLLKRLVKEPFVPWIKPSETEEELKNYLNILHQLGKIRFHPREQIRENLEQTFELISPYLHKNYHVLLKSDLDVFLEKGRLTVLNTFHGGILFLKVPESIEQISLEYFSDRPTMTVSVEFTSGQRASENVKYKPNAGKIERTDWHLTSLFPHIHQYPKRVQRLLLQIPEQMVKTICESYQGTPYMQVENEFPISFHMDNQLVSSEKIKLRK